MQDRSRRPEDSRNARQRAFEILRRVEDGGAYASRLLDHHETRLPDPREAGMLHELVLGVLRWQALLDHVVGSVASRAPEAMDPPVRRALRLGAYALLFLDRVPDFAAVDTAVELVKGGRSGSGARFVNGVLRALARKGGRALPGAPRPGDVSALAIARSHPEWWVRRKVEQLGWDDAVRLLEANNRPAPTILRPNLKRTTPRDLQRRLEAEEVRSEPCAVVREALRVTSGAPQRTRCFQRGYAWVQDEASQLIPRLFGRVLRPRVADLCAAPGVKSMQLSEALPVGEVVVAVDRHCGRLIRLRANLVRTGVEDILPLAADMAAQSIPLRRGFDHVLVDAPCSGTGTFRRHPEIRWRLRPEVLPKLVERQQRILETAASLVAPGGSIVYAVCSLEPEEGEGVTTSFLGRHPEFDVVDPRPSLPEAARRFVGEDGALRTSPDREDLDGFYGVLLARRRAPW